MLTQKYFSSGLNTLHHFLYLLKQGEIENMDPFDP